MKDNSSLDYLDIFCRTGSAHKEVADAGERFIGYLYAGAGGKVSTDLDALRFKVGLKGWYVMPPQPPECKSDAAIDD